MANKEYPFTANPFNALTEEERQALLAVAEYLTSSTIDISDEDLSEALNLMKPAKGCVPNEEGDGDLLNTVRRKFAAVCQTAMSYLDLLHVLRSCFGHDRAAGSQGYRTDVGSTHRTLKRGQTRVKPGSTIASELTVHAWLASFRSSYHFALRLAEGNTKF